MTKLIFTLLTFVAFGVNAQVFGSQMHSDVQKFIQSKPNIVNVVKNNYNEDNYAMCFAAVSAFEIDGINGVSKINKEMQLHMSIDFVLLGIARKALLTSGTQQGTLDNKLSYYRIKFNNPSNQIAIIKNCVAIRDSVMASTK